MNIPDLHLQTAVDAASKFEVKVVRLLEDSERTSRWLVRSTREHDAVEIGQAIAHEEVLYVLLVLHRAVTHEAGLAFTEVQSSDALAEGSIVDMFIDERIGFGFLFEYRAVLSIHTVFEHRAPTLAELATLLLAVLALSVRIRVLGYCLGVVTGNSLAVDSDGAILVYDPAAMHSVHQESGCCARGVSLDSVLSLLKELGEEETSSILADAARLSLEEAATENSLEVGLHVVKQIVTPSRIRFDDAVERLPQSSKGPILNDAMPTQSNQLKTVIHKFSRLSVQKDVGFRRKRLKPTSEI